MLGAVCVVAALLQIVLTAPAEVDNGQGQIWAVLVAGSNGWDNYRHQADVCHAYQIFHRHGVPDSNIIVMMYDDIAKNTENPDQGVIINKPNGPNVYPGVVKDYTGKAVTPKNFVKVLTGDKKGMEGIGSGKVLQSGPNDHVFVNFVDHGGPNIIGFPNDQVMYKHDLIKALKTMNKKKMYKKLVFYMEACESGSMFNKALPNNIEIFATTAANPRESSYACYWDDHVQNYLGDEYSISWMEDIDYEEHHTNLTTETLLKQYKDVVKRVKQSHPQMYGEKSIDKDHVTDFLGGGKSSKEDDGETELEEFKDSVSSRDVALHILNKKIELTTNEEVKEALQKKRQELIKGRKTVDDLFDEILSHVTNWNAVDQRTVKSIHLDLELEKMPCYKTIVDNFSNSCVNINRNTYALGHLYKFNNLCAMEYAAAEDVVKVFADVCTEEHRTLRGVN